MKTEEEIKQRLEEIKDALLDPNNNIPFYQGYANALVWTTTDEKQEAPKDD